MKLFNQIYKGSENKEALYDYFNVDKSNYPCIVFVHGYMGYKDWGCWNLFANYFYNNGYSIAKLNLTHNGTTIDNSTEFNDLETFANNSYSNEFKDVQLFLNHLESKYQQNRFILIGHSRGGGIVLLTSEDNRVEQIHCLAPISSIENRFPKDENFQKWRSEGVYFRENGRTKQKMPHNFSQYEDFIKNREKLNIQFVCKKNTKKVFVYHGADDTSVFPIEGENIARWSNGKYFLIEKANHTFGSFEPWLKDELPQKMEEVLVLILKNIIA